MKKLYVVLLSACLITLININGAGAPKAKATAVNSANAANKKGNKCSFYAFQSKDGSNAYFVTECPINK
ncbi:MAG: hypothetical protein P4L22_04170 [Candidatus Babeliales bacterium]|nr:hypothetical protein [Candidatus Babeliales bacterium]